MAIHNPFEFWGPLVRFLPAVFSYIAIHNAFGFGAIGSFFTTGFTWGDEKEVPTGSKTRTLFSPF